MRVDEGMRTLRMSQVKKYLHIGGVELISRTITGSSDENTNRHYLEELRRLYIAEYFARDTLFHGARSALGLLKSHGMHLSLATKKYNVLSRKILESLGIINIFDDIFAEGDTPFSKPSIEFCRICLPKDVPQHEILVIGDSDVDLVMAKNMGVRFLGFANGYNQQFIARFCEKNFSNYDHLFEVIEVG